MMEAPGLKRVQHINSIKTINCLAPIANRMVALPVYQYQSSIMEARGMRYIFCGTSPSYNHDSQLGKWGFKCLCTRIYYVMSSFFPGREVSCATKSFTLAGVDLFTDCLNLHAHPTNPPWKTFTLKLYASSNTMPGLEPRTLNPLLRGRKLLHIIFQEPGVCKLRAVDAVPLGS